MSSPSEYRVSEELRTLLGCLTNGASICRPHFARPGGGIYVWGQMIPSLASQLFDRVDALNEFVEDCLLL